MDPISTAVSAAGTTVKGTELAVKGWGWLQKRLWGGVDISEPVHKSLWTKEWIPVKGTHKGKKKGHYWLMTSNGSQYWPQGEVNFQHDGTWSAQLNLGLRPGPKNSIVVLVWVDDAVDALLKDIKRRNRFAQELVEKNNLDKKLIVECWSPFEMQNLSSRSFSVVTYRTVQFPPGPIQA
jgi:hypothetical protein